MRAIIAAMRDPTPDMMIVGGDLLADGYTRSDAARDNARGIWRAMIDAALTTDVKA